MKRSLILVCFILLSAFFVVSCAAPSGSGSLTTWTIPSATAEAISFEPPTQQPAATVEVLFPPLAAATSQQNIPLPSPPTQTPEAPAVLPPPPPIRFAVIGDFGSGDHNEGDVAELVKSWDPDFIITVGDNNYPDGAAETIDDNIGQFYHEYIGSYTGQYGQGSDQPRFFPVLGNHDLTINHGQAYFDYFTLPGNERYYDFTWGPVHFFMLNSDSREPDGVSSKSVQAQWLQSGLTASNSPWKLVIMHAPAYSSGTQGSVDWMRWPYKEWGADAALAGHDHDYERLLIDGFPYFVNGLGGGAIYAFQDTQEGSQKRYNDDYGAILVTVSEDILVFEFFNRGGELIDRFELQK